MKELFVCYELAIALKEKGFDEPCFAFYYSPFYKGGSRHQEIIFNEIQPHNTLNYAGFNPTKEGFGKWYIVAPLYQQVVDWLLIKHQISIEPYIHCDLRWGVTFVPDVMKTHKGSGNFTFFTGGKKLTNNYEGFSTKYEAINAAIEEALKLI